MRDRDKRRFRCHGSAWTHANGEGGKETHLLQKMHVAGVALLAQRQQRVAAQTPRGPEVQHRLRPSSLLKGQPQCVLCVCGVERGPVPNKDT